MEAGSLSCKQCHSSHSREDCHHCKVCTPSIHSCLCYSGNDRDCPHFNPGAPSSLSSDCLHPFLLLCFSFLLLFFLYFLLLPPSFGLCFIPATSFSFLNILMYNTEVRTQHMCDVERKTFPPLSSVGVHKQTDLIQ